MCAGIINTIAIEILSSWVIVDMAARERLKVWKSMVCMLRMIFGSQSCSWLYVLNCMAYRSVRAQLA